MLLSRRGVQGRGRATLSMNAYTKGFWAQTVTWVFKNHTDRSPYNTQTSIYILIYIYTYIYIHTHSHLHSQMKGEIATVRIARQCNEKF